MLRRQIRYETLNIDTFEAYKTDQSNWNLPDFTSKMKFTSIGLVSLLSTALAANPELQPTERRWFWLDAEGGRYNGLHVETDDSQPDRFFLKNEYHGSSPTAFFENNDDILRVDDRLVTIDDRTGAVQRIPKWCSQKVFSVFKMCQPKKYEIKDNYLCIGGICDFKGCEQLNGKVVLLADFGACTDPGPLKLKIVGKAAVL